LLIPLSLCEEFVDDLKQLGSKLAILPEHHHPFWACLDYLHEVEFDILGTFIYFRIIPWAVQKAFLLQSLKNLTVVLEA
jgi:hypothetical protein